EDSRVSVCKTHQCHDQLVQFNRLGHMHLKAGRARARCVLISGVSGEGDRRDHAALLVLSGTYLFDQVISVLARHSDVGQKQVRFPLSHHFKGFISRGAGSYFGAFQREHQAQHVPSVPIIIYHEYPYSSQPGMLRRLESRNYSVSPPYIAFFAVILDQRERHGEGGSVTGSWTLGINGTT